MSTAPVRSNDTINPGAATVDMKLEVVVIPVSDAERDAVLQEARLEARRRLSLR